MDAGWLQVRVLWVRVLDRRNVPLLDLSARNALKLAEKTGGLAWQGVAPRGIPLSEGTCYNGRCGCHSGFPIPVSESPAALECQ